MDECADRVQFEFGAEVGRERDEGADGASRVQQGRRERDTGDGQGRAVGVGGDQPGDSDQWRSVVEVPLRDSVVPALDRAAAAATDDQEADGYAQRDDPGRRPDKHQDTAANAPSRR